MDEPLTVTVHTSADGSRSLTVDRWPRETTIDECLLKSADPAYLTVDGDTVTIIVANGKAVYQLDRNGIDPRLCGIPASLVSSRLTARDQRDAGER